MSLYSCAVECTTRRMKLEINDGDFPGGPVDKNLLANVGDTGSIPGLGRFHMPRGN